MGRVALATCHAKRFARAAWLRSILLEKGVEKPVVIVLCPSRRWQELSVFRVDARRSTGFRVFLASPASSTLATFHLAKYPSNSSQNSSCCSGVDANNGHSQFRKSHGVYSPAAPANNCSIRICRSKFTANPFWRICL